MILVVDDDKNIRLSLKLILERNEYEVALAEGPKEATDHGIMGSVLLIFFQIK